MKKFFIWFLSVLITVLAIIYQRSTGPTYEKKTSITIDGTKYSFKLTRSHGGEKDCKITIPVADQQIKATLEFKQFPSKDEWTKLTMYRENETLAAILPHQPPAGKLEYKITLEKNGQVYPVNEGNPVIIRFKGDVPAAILIPHILFMFFAMFLSNLAGIMALFNFKKFRLYGKFALTGLFIGGLILGPFVQWYAFGEFWAGIPFAWDLTDNKTLLALIFWVMAVLMNRKKERPVYTAIAALVMLVVYSIPHSLYGSELNPETGKVIQGMISLFYF
jgi:hypothetical protein